ncbi:MAG: toll/interleukin-1 receptor domain-containing protein, partial [Bacilli bacterium]|nr:toll/interleukin-1 receptor domain-containing protein [Bacilli bacterium]
MNENVHPKLFISYSWDCEDNNNHMNWVLKLATNLRMHGVDVYLDQWDARLGNDLAFFMEQGLTSSQLVLCVCSENYVKKANSGKGGVGYEKRILSADLMSNINVNYIIPIIRNNQNKTLPHFLSGLKYADFSIDKDYLTTYTELLARIYNEDLKRKPELGNNPFSSTQTSCIISQLLNIQEVEFYNPTMCDIVKFDYKRNSGKYTIGEGDYKFTIKFSECGCNSIYCYRDHILRIGYNPKFKSFPEPQDFQEFDYTSRCKSLLVGEVLILENHMHKFAAIKILSVKKNNVDIDHLVEFSYKIYNDIELVNMKVNLTNNIN